MKRKLAILLCLSLMLFAVAGCKAKSSGNSAGSKETVTVKYVLPGNKSTDFDAVQAKINEKLKSDGTGLQINQQFIPWDSWTDKTNLMLSSGEAFDLFPIMQDMTPVASYYSNGGLSDIKEYVDKYGSNLKKVISDSILKSATIDGKLVAIPANWLEQASTYGVIDIRTDLLKKYSLSMPTTSDELLNDMKTVQKNWTGASKIYMTLYPSYNDMNTEFTGLHRSYDTWPFIVKDAFFYIDQKGNVKSWFSTDEFKKDCEFMDKAYSEGLINPDILTQTSDQINKSLDTGNFFMRFGTAGTLAGLKANNANATNADLQAFYLNPEKAYIRPSGFKNSVGVPSTSKHPEAAVKFMNWLYANQSNYDLFFYGIEGKDWNNTGDKTMTQVLGSDGSALYTANDWMNGNIAFERYDNINGIPSNNKVRYTENKSAVDSVALGFTFDASNVQTEYTNIQSVAKEVMTPIVMGVQDYNSHINAAVAKLKTAGLDKVLAEYQSQFKKYLTDNNIKTNG